MNAIERREAKRSRARSAEYGKASISYLRAIARDPKDADNWMREESAVTCAVEALREARTAVGLEEGTVRFF